ncbi:site-specific DNA-methyltransferase [Vibrio crassostreae]|uniref:site-specific DNA-methyltransferase n=1 Tax=Vibrio crassostreae TaxID=246167 RepID=UPI0002F8A5E7|nr:site-specific DNA-methyltransferase [Vibrio crassostreae]OEE87824.1 hypothetical protein A140_07355 [Vibrio crassostreae 9ZC88]
MNYIASQSRFVELMTELFQLDEAEALDFGLYRIIKRNNKEVRAFLGEVKQQGEDKILQGGKLADLLEQAFAKADDEEDATVRSRLKVLGANLGITSQMPKEEVSTKLEQLEAIPATREQVKEYCQLLAQQAQTKTADSDRNEVLNRLYQFFARHYQDGDFIVERRYSKDGSRYIRSTGEDTESHWATEDMYYIKSGDLFTDYPVQLSNSQKFTFSVEPDVLQSTRENLKPNEKARYAINKIVNSSQGLKVILDYEKGTQTKKATDEIVDSICANISADKKEVKRWFTHFVARNKSDFFIHKKLRQALNDDLDIYIKTEVIDVEQMLVEGDLPNRVINVARVVRLVAQQIIAFLATLEEFQKQLWEKKKLVFETRYIITLDRLADLAGSDWLDAHLASIVASQSAEWKDLGLGSFGKASDCIEIKTDSLNTQAQMRYLPLPIDTKNFDNDFKWELLATVSKDHGLEKSLDGVAIHSDNWQAINTIQDKYRDQVKCIYIDPPYNTGGDGFPYKDAYRHASWMAMMENRVGVSYPMLKSNSAFFTSIGDDENTNLRTVLDSVFSAKNHVEQIIWAKNTNKNQSPTYSTNHEYVHVFSKSISDAKSDLRMFREPKPGAAEVLAFVARLNEDYPAISDVERKLSLFFEEHKDEYKSVLEDQGVDYQISLDPWKGTFNYCKVEYRDYTGLLVPENKARQQKASLWVFCSDNASMPLVKGDSQKAEFRDPDSPMYRFYRPIHPKTKASCPAPKRGWAWPLNRLEGQTSCFLEKLNEDRIIFGSDEKNVPRVKKFLHETMTQVGKSVVLDYTDGEKQLTSLFGKSRTFPSPKPTTLITRLIQQTCDSDDFVMDFFAGSGTTLHSALLATREDEKKRKIILVDAGQHFESILLKRAKKCSFSLSWKNGIPEVSDGLGLFIRVQSIEQYEDTLENLSNVNEPIQSLPLDNPELTLSYRMATEAQDIYCDIKHIRSPFGYKLHRTEGGGNAPLRDVDLVESLIYLLGLQVTCLFREDEGVVLTGFDRRKRSTTVLFRDCQHTNGNAWCENRLQEYPADRVLTNAMAELSFAGCELLEAIEDVFAGQFSGVLYG